ncbi:GTP cyclohydrolase I FolE [Leptospira sp. GIMC2001]|uniref:GTP cyclohydrolase I FolE n=1 Tax=Leptospira sp. GIMC2001 TaxID=1513297 RepID=UPI002349889A|nr:GTP cyclohydrolase I FolE [Leptospira sp. GIMC2001]WCL48354.1 GTP cyclohydrolase I FolE [Leptospira sp. GIMC2001]
MSKTMLVSSRKLKEKLMILNPEYEVFTANGDDHILTSIETPLRKDAFDKTDNEKIANIQKHFALIMDELGLDLTDDSLKGTPYRVAKMFVQEIFSGLNPENKPSISVFENKYQYNKMLVESNISVASSCEHHFLPILGKAHVGYISNGRVIGLSKINRIVDYFAKRPQVQERMTVQIFNELKSVLNTEDVIVVVEASHMCVSTRGINDKSSMTTTIEYGGQFTNVNMRSDFFQMVYKKT